MIELSAASPHVLFTGLLALTALRRHGILPFPSGTILLLCASQIVSSLVAAGAIEDRDLRTFLHGGIEDHFETTMLLYDVLALLALLSCAGAHRSAEPILRFDGSGERAFPIFLAAPVALSLSLLQAVSIDVAHLVSHRDYLSIVFDEIFLATFGETVAMTLFRATPFVAALNAALLVYFLMTGRRRSAAVFLAVCAWQYLYLLSISSRAAAFGPIVIGVSALVLPLPARRSLFAASGALTIYALLHALVGRGMPGQGMAELPTVFAAVFSDRGYEAGSQLAVNLCQGIFVIAEGWRFEPAFSAEYSWLSLSPLPSFLDGFSDVLPQQVRLHDYVPMSAITELASFGPPHAAIVLASLCILIRWHFRLADRPFAFLAVNVLIFIALYVALTYPLRFSLRYVWLGYAIAFLASLDPAVRGRRLAAEG